MREAKGGVERGREGREVDELYIHTNEDHDSHTLILPPLPGWPVEAALFGGRRTWHHTVSYS